MSINKGVLIRVSLGHLALLQGLILLRFIKLIFVSRGYIVAVPLVKISIGPRELLLSLVGRAAVEIWSL